MDARPFTRAVAAGTLALLVAVPAKSVAQEPGTIGVSGQAGLGVPLGSLADVSEVGPAFRFGTDLALSDGFALQGLIGAEVLPGVTGRGGEGPTVRLFRLTVGPSLSLVRSPAPTGFGLAVRGGLGATLFTAGRSLVGTGSRVRIIDFTEVYPGLDGGFSAQYSLSSSVGLHLDAGLSVSFADEEDTEGFAFLDPEVEPFSTLVSVPLTAGIRLSFPPR